MWVYPTLKLNKELKSSKNEVLTTRLAFGVITSRNYCRSRQIHSLPMSTTAWTEHNELKHLEIRPHAYYLTVKPTVAKQQVEYSCWDCRALQAFAMRLHEHLRWDMWGEDDWRPRTWGCFLWKIKLYQFKQQQKKKNCIHFSFAPTYSVWLQCEFGQCFVFMLQPSAEPVCNANVPWCTAAHSCEHYHRLPQVIAVPYAQGTVSIYLFLSQHTTPWVHL